MAAATKGDIRATTTAEVIQEFAHVRARPRSRDDAAELARSYAVVLSPLLAENEEDVVAGLGLWTQHRALACFDAVLAATSIRAGATGFVSADRAFAAVVGLSHVDPADPAAVATLLA